MGWHRHATSRQQQQQKQLQLRPQQQRLSQPQLLLELSCRQQQQQQQRLAQQQRPVPQGVRQPVEQNAGSRFSSRAKFTTNAPQLEDSLSHGVPLMGTRSLGAQQRWTDMETLSLETGETAILLLVCRGMTTTRRKCN